MVNKLKVLSLSLLMALGLSISLSSTAHASESEDLNPSSITTTRDESTITALEQKGYLETDSVAQSVKITDKYKQEVLKNVDTSVYNVNFTSNSVEISPKIEARAFTGVTKIVYTWKGFDLYLNSGDAYRLAAGLGIGGILAGLIPEPVVSKAIGIALGVAAGLVAYNNADGRGVIIAFIGKPNASSVPHWITSQ